MSKVSCLNYILGLCILARLILPLQAADNSVAEGLRPKKFIVAIGIGHFKNSLWHELRYARKDARDVFNYFKAPAQGFDGGELLIDEEHPLLHTDVISSLEHLRQDNRNEEDTVIVYVSTHGTVAYKEDGKVGRYIISSDTDPLNIKQTAIDYDELMERFQKLKSRKKVLILAFCHSGVGKSILTPDMKRVLAQLKSPYFAEPIQERSEGSIVLTASGWREPAMEDERLQNDVYTHFLLEGFNHDRNGDGAVSVTEAHAFASQATFEYTQGRQRPSAIMELLGSDPVIVSGSIKKKTKGASLFSLLDRFASLTVSIDGKDYGSIAKGLTVPDGQVRLTLRDPGQQRILADRVVNFQAGREYSIADYLLPRLPHSFGLGMRTYQLQNSRIKRSYMPHSLLGLDLNYVYAEAFWLYDLVIDLSYFPERTEYIELSDADLVNSRFVQQKSMLLAMIGLSKRSMIETLSTADRAVKTEFRWVVGMNGLGLKRNLEAAAFEHREQFASSGGLSLGGGLETMWVYHLIRAGGDLRVDLLQNFTDRGSRFVTASSLAMHLGTFW